jgi:hypothetical protein
MMTYRLALFSLVGVAALFKPAMAASPGYCQKYATAAVGQYNMATQKYPQCAAGISGNRWLPDFNAHYSWCLTADPAAAQAEWDRRGQYLYLCSRNLPTN